VFWAPKSACSAIATSFVCDVLGWSEQEMKRKGIGPRRLLRNEGYMLNDTDGYKLVRDKGFKSIALLRDPYDRLISAYINKFVSYHRRPIDSFAKLEPFAKRTYLWIRGVGKAEDLDIYDGLTFEEFVQGVSEQIRLRQGREPGLNHHWNTQVPFYFYEKRFEYDFVYDIKNIGGFFAELSRLMGRPMSCRHRNRTEKREGIESDCSRMTSVELAHLGATISYQALRRDDLQELVAKAYEPDMYYLARAKAG
jgi:hypothetical protein